MKKKKASTCYKNISLETASPGKLILMLYDGSLKFISLAKKGFNSDSARESYEQINNNITRATNIISELKACLDMSVEGDFSGTMFNLYEYMEALLCQANIKKQIDPILEVEKILKEIRDAWAEMLAKHEDPKVNTASLSCTA